jgi:hypothetical protein
MLMVCGVKVGKAIEVYVRRDRPTESGGTVGGEAYKRATPDKADEEGNDLPPDGIGWHSGEAPINGLHQTRPMRRGMVYHPTESGGTVGRGP